MDSFFPDLGVNNMPIITAEFFYGLSQQFENGDTKPVIEFSVQMGLLSKSYLCPTCGKIILNYRVFQRFGSS